MNHGFDERPIQDAAKTIARGGVIAFRTDTFYGLGADPFNREAVRKIRQLKGREDQKPILIVISEHNQINRLITERTQWFYLLSERLCPGPLRLMRKPAPRLSAAIT